jgi:hypothetical protein
VFGTYIQKNRFKDRASFLVPTALQRDMDGKGEPVSLFLFGGLPPPQNQCSILDLGFGAGAFGSGYSLQVLSRLRASAAFRAFRCYPFPESSKDPGFGGLDFGGFI